jgi:polyhydroxyalkanoate synthesis regulator phasin
MLLIESDVEIPWTESQIDQMIGLLFRLRSQANNEDERIEELEESVEQLEASLGFLRDALEDI